MVMDDLFGKFDDILYKPIEAIVDYVKEPLAALHSRRSRKDAEHAAQMDMQQRQQEEQLKLQSAREAAELEMEMQRVRTEMELMVQQQEDERRDRIVESIKRYQLELATASRDIVNSIGLMSLELRERANDMVRENTAKYKQIQNEAMDDAAQRLEDIQKRYAGNERVRIRMEDTVMRQMESIIDTAARFIAELSEDLKRMNTNTDTLVQLQMQNVNNYLDPMKSALAVGLTSTTHVDAIGCSDFPTEIIEVES